jgi:hypothetical protein
LKFTERLRELPFHETLAAGQSTTPGKGVEMRVQHNVWYVGALSEQIDRQLRRKLIVDKPVLLYRTEAGQVIALRDRCAFESHQSKAGSGTPPWLFRYAARASRGYSIAEAIARNRD